MHYSKHTHREREREREGTYINPAIILPINIIIILLLYKPRLKHTVPRALIVTLMNKMCTAPSGRVSVSISISVSISVSSRARGRG